MGRKSWIFVGRALSVSGELRGGRTERDGGDFFHGIGVGLRSGGAGADECGGRGCVRRSRFRSAKERCGLVGGHRSRDWRVHPGPAGWRDSAGCGRSLFGDFDWRCRADRDRVRFILLAGVTVSVFALGPLVPWTIRNFKTLHRFQPLAPRYATDADEVDPRGFNRWVSTWMEDYTSVEEIYWNVPGDKIDATKLPARALDTAKDETLALIAEYNETQQLTPELACTLPRDRSREHSGASVTVLHRIAPFAGRGHVVAASNRASSG